VIVSLHSISFFFRRKNLQKKKRKHHMGIGQSSGKSKDQQRLMEAEIYEPDPELARLQLPAPRPEEIAAFSPSPMLIAAALSASSVRPGKFDGSNVRVEKLLLYMKSTVAWTHLCSREDRRFAGAWLRRLVAAAKQADVVPDDVVSGVAVPVANKEATQEAAETKEPASSPSPSSYTPSDALLFLCLRAATSEPALNADSLIGNLESVEGELHGDFNKLCPTDEEKSRLKSWLESVFRSEELSFMSWASARFSPSATKTDHHVPGPDEERGHDQQKFVPSRMLLYAVLDTARAINRFESELDVRIFLKKLSVAKSWRIWTTPADRQGTRNWLFDLVSEARYQKLLSASRSPSGTGLEEVSSSGTGIMGRALSTLSSLFGGSSSSSSEYSPSAQDLMACIKASTYFIINGDDVSADSIIKLLKKLPSTEKQGNNPQLASWLRSITQFGSNESDQRRKAWSKKRDLFAEILSPLPSYFSPDAAEEQDLQVRKEPSVQESDKDEDDGYKAWKPSKALLLTAIYGSACLRSLNFQKLHRLAQGHWCWQLACSASDRRYASRWFRQIEHQVFSAGFNGRELPTDLPSDLCYFITSLAAAVNFDGKKFSFAKFLMDELANYRASEEMRAWLKDLFEEEQRLFCQLFCDNSHYYFQDVTYGGHRNQNGDLVRPPFNASTLGLLRSSPLLLFAILNVSSRLRFIQLNFMAPSLAHYITMSPAFAACPADDRKQLLPLLHALLIESTRLSESHATLANHPPPITATYSSNTISARVVGSSLEIGLVPPPDWAPSPALVACAMKACVNGNRFYRKADVPGILERMRTADEEAKHLWNHHCSEADRANAQQWLSDLVETALTARALNAQEAEKKEEGEKEEEEEKEEQTEQEEKDSVKNKTSGPTASSICGRCLAAGSATDSKPPLKQEAVRQKDSTVVNAVDVVRSFDLSGAWTADSELAVSLLAVGMSASDVQTPYKLKLRPDEVQHLVFVVEAMVKNGAKMISYDAATLCLTFSRRKILEHA
jgi:hypothetical protein